MKILTYILIATILTGCAATPRMTIDRVERDCFLYNVEGFGLKDEMPQYEVVVVGDEIASYCTKNGVVHRACTDGYNIWTEYDHWRYVNAELCHIAYKVSWHSRRSMEPEIIDDKVR